MINCRFPGAESESLSRSAFLRLLFRLLDEHKVRYCVLHSYEGLPEYLDNDLDLAVDPYDVEVLPSVFWNLRNRGYRPVQCVNYAVKGYCFDFTWFEGLSLNSVSVDIAFEYRRGGLILIPGERLTGGRRRRGDFWVSDQKIEFAYLLAKKTHKATVPTNQEEQLRLLVEGLGRREAEKTAENLFGDGLKSQVVEACTGAHAGELLKKLKKRLWWSVTKRNPLNPIRCLIADALRLTHRWFEPTGLFVVVLGPDGVGKSALIDRLTDSLRPPFQHHRVFHARPMLLWPREHFGPVTEPHAKPPRSRIASIGKLLALLPDYWLGYCLVARPLLARSGLVIFDRYFQDMLVDPLRYRDGAPAWLPKFLCRFVTPPETLFLILDAPEEVVLSRKQEVPLDELRRQRAAYRQLGHELPNAVFICNDQDIEFAIADAKRAIIEHLARRFQYRHSSWLVSERLPAGDQKPRGNSDEPLRAKGPLHDALRRFIGPAARPVPQSQKQPVDTGSTLLPVVVLKHPSKHTDQRLARNGFAHLHRFVVLPSFRAPRWLLPVGDSSSLSGAFHIYTPYARSAQILKETANQLMKRGWNGRGCSRVLIASKERLPLENLVTEVTGEREPAFSMSLGVGGDLRKLTVQVMGRHGNILGYIKLPMFPKAITRIQNEAMVLNRLWNFPELRPHIPKVLYSGEWCDGFVLIQSSGPLSPGPAEFGVLHENFLRALRNTYQVQRAGRELVEEVAARWQNAALHLDMGLCELGEKALARANYELKSAMISCGIMHGDFAPWNTRSDTDRLFALDWESAAWDLPFLWDEFHFHIQVADFLKRNKGEHLLRGLSESNRGCFLLYLLNSISVYAEDLMLNHPGIAHRRRILIREVC